SMRRLQPKHPTRPSIRFEPEEKLLEDKVITCRPSFVRLFDETVAAIRFPFEHGGKAEMLSLQQINAKLYSPDRTARAAAAGGLTRGLQGSSHLLTFILNTLVLDHRSDCDLRHFSSAMAPRHLANE